MRSTPGRGLIFNLLALLPLLFLGDLLVSHAKCNGRLPQVSIELVSATITAGGFRLAFDFALGFENVLLHWFVYLPVVVAELMKLRISMRRNRVQPPTFNGLGMSPAETSRSTVR